MSARRLLDTMRHSRGNVGLLWGGSEWMETFEYPPLFLSPLTFLPLSFCLSFSCWFHLVATFSLCCISPFPCLSVKHSIPSELPTVQIFYVHDWQLSVIFKLSPWLGMKIIFHCASTLYSHTSAKWHYEMYNPKQCPLQFCAKVLPNPPPINKWRDW